MNGIGPSEGILIMWNDDFTINSPNQSRNFMDVVGRFQMCHIELPLPMVIDIFMKEDVCGIPWLVLVRPTHSHRWWWRTSMKFSFTVRNQVWDRVYVQNVRFLNFHDNANPFIVGKIARWILILFLNIWTNVSEQYLHGIFF